MKKIFKIDKKSVDKSKQYLWRYIQKKKNLGAFAKKEKKAFFANLFAPKKIAWASATAVITIIAVVVGPNLQNLMQGGIGIQQNIANASFEMRPSNQDSTGIEASTKFTLTSSEDLDASLVEANLKTTPETDLNVLKIGEGEYEVTSAKPLNPNTVYTFTIVSQNENGPEEFSWAYQVKDEFKITGTLPGDKTTGVPTNSGIEINFSHEQFSVDTARDYIDISPEVKGTFEKHQKTLVFVPSEPLAQGTIYTVTVKEGLPLTGSDKTLKEEKTFQFETSQTSKLDSAFHFTKNYYEVGTNQPVALKGYINMDLEEETIAAQTNIYKFAGQKEYLDFISEKNKLPSWATAARNNYKVDLTKLTKITSIDGQIGEVDWQSYIYLPDIDLKAGYYVVQVNINDHSSQTLLQVTDISSYITVTKTDSLVWVNDVKTDKPIENATVKIIETGEIAKTDKHGIAKFKLTPSEFGYYNVSISSVDGKSLITELQVDSKKTDRSDYWSLIKTDRPVYLPNDKIQFWGFMKPRTDDVPTAKDLKMKFTRAWGGTFVKTVDYKMESDNTFSGSFDINQVPPGYYYLSLYDGDNYIMQQSLQVQTYKKPTYNIKVEADKNAYYEGETIHYSVVSEFFDGTPMPNLKLAYTDNDTLTGGTKYVTTDDQGKASIDEKARITHSCAGTSAYCYDVTTNSITLRPIIGEDSDIFGEDFVRVFRSHLNLNAQTESKNDLATINISTDWIDLDKLNNETNTSYNDYLGKPAGERTINGTITEKYWKKVEIGQHYDFIEKKTVKEYRYESREAPFEEFTVKTDTQGKAVYELKMNPNKYYEIKLVGKDNNGKEAHFTTYAYNSESRENDFYRIDIINENASGFNIGDTVKAVLTNGDSPVSDFKGGRVLFLQYNNGLVDYSIKNDAYYSFKFGKNHVPGVTINSVFFDGNTYQTGWGNYAKLNTENRQLQVDIRTDKESYEPGEKVRLSIKTLDKDGKPVQTEVNVNLVDEAYYKAVYDNIINPLSKVYSNSSDGILANYSSHENPEIRANSADMGGCFIAGTQILMADDSYKAIEDIRKGDTIMTKKDPYSNMMVTAEVSGKVKHLIGQYLLVNEDLGVTKEHVLLINGKWNLAGNLKIGDSLRGKNGEQVYVTSIRTISEPMYVYNFEVEKYHTYIANNIYVHNDKGGDGVRNDFEDTAIFKSVKTDGQGNANLEFQIPDNVTTWRVMATAVDTNKVRIGTGTDAVKVTLPLFGDLVMNKEYSVKDSPQIGLRAFGTSLSEDDKVAFKLKAESLGLKTPKEIDGVAYKASYEALPKLTKGTHTVQLDVAANGEKDALSEDILVKGSRLNKSVVKVIPTVTGESDIPLPDNGYAQVYLMDAGVSSYYGSLLNLYYSHGERFEKRLGEKAAIELLKKYFGQDFNPHYNTDLLDYQLDDGGLAILPYADSDLDLTALTLAFDNNSKRYNNQNLVAYLENHYKNVDSNLDEITASLLGLASMHKPVLTSLQTIKDDKNLSTLDKLYIGLAFKRLGSKAEAEDMYKKATSEIAKNSFKENALASILAASLQHRDEAVTYWEDAMMYADKDDLINLYLLGYVKEGIAYASDKNVSFKVEVGGLSETKTLSGCRTFSALVNKKDGIRISDIDGNLAAVVFYEKSVEPKDFKGDNRVNIKRTYSIINNPDQTELQVDDIVKITLEFSVDPSLPEGSYNVVDVLPSGLQIMGISSGMDRYNYQYMSNPYQIINQEVRFLYYPGEYSTPVRTYYAKVIHPGKFYADPAKIEMFRDPEIANISAAKSIVITRGT